MPPAAIVSPGFTMIFSTLPLAWLMTTRAQRFAEYGDTTVHLQLAISPVAWLMAALLLLTALVHALFVFSPPIPVAHGETTP